MLNEYYHHAKYDIIFKVSKKSAMLKFLPHTTSPTASLTLIITQTQIFHVSQKPKHKEFCRVQKHINYIP